MEQDQEPVRCLFCVQMIDSIDSAIQHLNDEHHVDLSIIKRKFNMDQYAYIKMINYIRVKNVDASVMVAIDSQVWNDDVYLKPVEVDAWLMFGEFRAKQFIIIYISSKCVQFVRIHVTASRYRWFEIDRVNRCGKIGRT